MFVALAAVFNDDTYPVNVHKEPYDVISIPATPPICTTKFPA